MRTVRIQSAQESFLTASNLKEKWNLSTFYTKKYYWENGQKAFYFACAGCIHWYWSFQTVLEQTRESAEKAWEAAINEEQLLQRIQQLEDQLKLCWKGAGEDKLRDEVKAMLDDKSKYETLAKESLRRAQQVGTAAPQGHRPNRLKHRSISSNVSNLGISFGLVFGFRLMSLRHMGLCALLRRLSLSPVKQCLLLTDEIVGEVGGGGEDAWCGTKFGEHGNRMCAMESAWCWIATAAGHRQRFKSWNAQQNDNTTRTTESKLPTL